MVRNANPGRHRLSQGRLPALALLLLISFLLIGCDSEAITVPSSDSTPPIARMSVIITNRDGSRESFTLTSADSSETRDLALDEPVAILASGRDPDGGVKNITINGGLTVFCLGQDTGLSIHILAQNPDDAVPGETASTVLLKDWTFDPVDQCPEGVGNISGVISATAENFHGGTDTTAAFIFEIHQ